MASARAEGILSFQEATSLSSSNKVRIRSSSLGQKSHAKEKTVATKPKLPKTILLLISFIYFKNLNSPKLIRIILCKSLLLSVLNGNTKLPQPSIQETDDSIIIFTEEGKPILEYLKKPSKEASSALHPRFISIHCILLQAKFSRAIMQRIILISTESSLHGPNRVFRPRGKNWATFVTYAPNGIWKNPRMSKFPSDEPIIIENWRIEIHAKQKDYYLIDLISSQTCATNDPLVIQKYHYGGMAIRGNGQWERQGWDACWKYDYVGGNNRENGHSARVGYPCMDRWMAGNAV